MSYTAAFEKDKWPQNVLAQESLSTAHRAMCPSPTLLFRLYSTNTKDEPPHDHTYQRMMGGAGTVDLYLETSQHILTSSHLIPFRANELGQELVSI